MGLLVYLFNKSISTLCLLDKTVYKRRQRIKMLNNEINSIKTLFRNEYIVGLIRLIMYC